MHPVAWLYLLPLEVVLQVRIHPGVSSTEEGMAIAMLLDGESHLLTEGGYCLPVGREVGKQLQDLLIRSNHPLSFLLRGRVETCQAQDLVHRNIQSVIFYSES
jgi:hypothetical protein